MLSLWQRSGVSSVSALVEQLGAPGRLRVRSLLLLNVLLALVLQQSEVFVHLLESVMLAVERMNHMVFFRINLVINVDNLLDEVDELLHLFAEEQLNVLSKLLPQNVDPFLAWTILRESAAFRTIVDVSSTAD